MTSQTQLIMITGYPLAHSQSPAVHSALYQQLNIDAVCLAFPIADDVAGIVHAQRVLQSPLLIVTLPHKEKVLRYCDAVDASAKAVGAANTVINRQGKLTAYNTDVAGAKYALQNQELRIKNQGCGIIGAGGAARSVVAAVRGLGGKLHFYNRTLAHAKKLAREFGGQAHILSDLGKIKLRLLCNATSVGMWPNSQVSPVSANVFNRGMIAFDVVYNPKETQFLRDAKRAGCTTISGQLMFAAQAAEQIRLWSGRRVKPRQIVNLLEVL